MDITDNKMHNSNDDINNFKNKINKYENTLDILLNDSIIYNRLNEIKKKKENKLCQSIYTKRDNNGYEQSYRKTDIGDFCIIETEEFDDPSTLNKKTLDIINNHQQFHNYLETKKYIKKGITTWGVLSSITSVTKYFIGFAPL